MAAEEERSGGGSDGASEEDGASPVARPSTASSSGPPHSSREKSGGVDDTPVPSGRRKASLGHRGTVFVPDMAGLSEGSVQGLREIFGLFDDGTGKVEPLAVQMAASEAGLEKDNPTIFRLLTGLTSDEPVDFEEFLTLLTEPIGDWNSKQGVQRLFGLIGPEAQATGSFNDEDLQNMLQEMGLDADEEDVRDMLEKAGADADFNIVLDAFYSALTE
mmetsp:Transcript_103128/g.199810  ORF Transcript_103128/g.199810 Transcript_103128/m.199810 type:complete len:217 (+) Transcript_103128:165-815(+)